MLAFTSCTKDEAMCTPEHESEIVDNETRAVIVQDEASGTFSGMGSLSSDGPRSDQPGSDDEDGDGITDDEDDEDEDDERSSNKNVKK